MSIINKQENRYNKRRRLRRSYTQPEQRDRRKRHEKIGHRLNLKKKTQRSNFTSKSSSRNKGPIAIEIVYVNREVNNHKMNY